MNNSNDLQLITKSQNLNKSSFDDFFQNDDVLKMAEENIDEVFTSIKKSILKEAVYPHLSNLSI